jgi:trk system potassium uptake protein TrkA
MGAGEYILVVGCGRLGAHVAGQLSRLGHSVVVVDADEASFGSLSHEFSGFRLEGDATELAVLRQAKAERADRLIAVTSDDNVNLAVAQTAKVVFRVPHVVARVSDPQREEIFRVMGVHTVCPLSLAEGELLRSLGLADKASRNRDQREQQERGQEQEGTP